MQAAQKLRLATDGISLENAVGQFLGAHSFSAGVMAGMAKNLLVSAIELAKLFKMFAMAEYYESQHTQSFWDKLRSGINAIGKPGMHGTMLIANYVWPEFDREAEEAFQERSVLIATVAYVFEHPGEVLAKISAEQQTKWEKFKQYRDRQTLAGEFQAGMLLGELLMEIILLVDGVTALAKLAAKIPGLLRLLESQLQPVMRAAQKTLSMSTGKVLREAPKPLTGVVYDKINPFGKPPATSMLRQQKTPRDKIATEAGLDATEATALAMNLARGKAEKIFLDGMKTEAYISNKSLWGQKMDYSCVAASCKMAAELSDIPEAYIREALSTKNSGTGMANVPEGLKALGYEGSATYTTNMDKILQSSLAKGDTNIVSVWQGGGNSHAIVVDAIVDGRAYIRDPWPQIDGSSYSMSFDDLKSAMTGRGVVISSGKN